MSPPTRMIKSFLIPLVGLLLAREIVHSGRFYMQWEWDDVGDDWVLSIKENIFHLFIDRRPCTQSMCDTIIV